MLLSQGALRKQGSSFVVVPDAAHLVNAEQPLAVNEVLADHLGRQRPGRA